MGTSFAPPILDHPFTHQALPRVRFEAGPCHRTYLPRSAKRSPEIANRSLLQGEGVNYISRKYEILLNIFQTRNRELFMSIALYHLPSWIANLIVVKLCLRRQGGNQWHVGLSHLHIYLRQANDPVALPTPSAVPDSQNSSACPQETQRREIPATIIAGVEKNFLMWELHFCSFCRTKRFLLPSDPTELILRMSNRDAP